MDQVADFWTLDAMWDFYDPEATEGRFREFLGQPHSDELKAETLTQIARTMGLRKRFTDAHSVLDEAAAIAPPRSRATVRLQLERGRVFNSGGDPASARPLFVSAWELARDVGEDALAVDAAHMVAIVEDVAGQIEWNTRAMELARSSSNPKARGWLPSLLNNLAWTYHDQGDLRQALAMFEEAQRLRAEGDDVIAERIARWCVARCLRSTGRADEALAIQRALLGEQEGKGPGYVEEELGECLAALERAEEARPYFQIAFEKLNASGEIDSEPERLARLERMAKTG